MKYQQREPAGHSLYQLWSTIRYPPGADFLVNGPYDSGGIVVKVLRKEEITGMTTRYLHLVRGTGR
jgi:hypothetical protein